MFELISQSRYELQQQYLFNPNKLQVNTNNRYGIVDASGNVSAFKSVSHPNFGEFVNNQALSAQPNLIVDHFGTGKNAILFNGTSDFLINVDTPYTPNWDDEFWFALNFKTTNKANNCILANGQGILFAGGTGLRTSI